MVEKMTAYTIQDIPNSLWERFKDIVPKSKTMSEAIIELIKKEVESK